MSGRPVYLLKSRASKIQRHHFAVFIPAQAYANVDLSDRQSDCIGTLINVVGAPMSGFAHEVIWSHNAASSTILVDHVVLGYISQKSIENTALDESDDKVATRGPLVDAAYRIAPPQISANFMAPVNDTTNRRCQEWTMDYIRALVRLDLLPAEAVDIAQGERDYPSYGIGLRPVGQR